jgi:hypothetical protein
MGCCLPGLWNITAHERWQCAQTTHKRDDGSKAMLSSAAPTCQAWTTLERQQPLLAEETPKAHTANSTNLHGVHAYSQNPSEHSAKKRRRPSQKAMLLNTCAAAGMPRAELAGIHLRQRKGLQTTHCKQRCNTVLHSHYYSGSIRGHTVQHAADAVVLPCSIHHLHLLLHHVVCTAWPGWSVQASHTWGTLVVNATQIIALPQQKQHKLCSTAHAAQAAAAAAELALSCNTGEVHLQHEL